MRALSEYRYFVCLEHEHPMPHDTGTPRNLDESKSVVSPAFRTTVRATVLRFLLVLVWAGAILSTGSAADGPTVARTLAGRLGPSVLVAPRTYQAPGMD